MRRLARRTASGVAAATVAAATLTLVFLGVGPHTGMYRTLTVLSASMAPAIASGSVVVVVPQDASTIARGDVITYEAPLPHRPVVTHRVVEVVGPGRSPVVRTKGDAAVDVDPWTARLHGPQVWRVRASIPWLGSLVAAMRTDAVRRLTSTALPAALVASYLVTIWRPRREDHGPVRHDPQIA